MKVGGVQPDELFVRVPDDATINKYLLSEAGTRQCGCNPKKCRDLILKGVISKDKLVQLQVTLKDVYSKANPGELV